MYNMDPANLHGDLSVRGRQKIEVKGMRIYSSILRYDASSL